MLVCAIFKPGSADPVTVTAMLDHEPEAAQTLPVVCAKEGLFAATEEVETPSGADDVHGALVAVRWARDNRQRLANMAMLFHWDMAHLDHVKPGKLLLGTLPVPRVGPRDIESVLGLLSHCPAYRGQSVIAIAEDWTVVGMRGGRTARLGEDSKEILRSMADPGVDPASAADRLERAVELALSGGA